MVSSGNERVDSSDWQVHIASPRGVIPESLWHRDHVYLIVPRSLPPPAHTTTHVANRISLPLVDGHVERATGMG